LSVRTTVGTEFTFSGAMAVAFPHSGQNLDAFGISNPQLEQNLVSLSLASSTTISEPQFLQNLAPSTTSSPQF
jgi:hypothetical protein